MEKVSLLTESQLKQLVSEAVAQGIERVSAMLTKGADDYIKEQDAAARLSVSIQVLRQMRKSGTGPAYTENVAGVRYKVSDLHAFMDSGRVDPLL